MADYKVGDLVHDTHRKDEGMVVQATSTDAGYQTVVVLFVGASAPYTYQVLKDETIPGLVRMVDEYQRVAPRGAAKLKANQIVDPSPGALATPHVAGGPTVVATAKYEGQTKGVVGKVLQRLRSSDHVGVTAKLQLPVAMAASRDDARAAIWSMVQEEFGLTGDVISGLPSDEQARAFQAIIDAGNKVFAEFGIDDTAKSGSAISRLRELNTVVPRLPAQPRMPTPSGGATRDMLAYTRTEELTRQRTDSLFGQLDDIRRDIYDGTPVQKQRLLDIRQAINDELRGYSGSGALSTRDTARATELEIARKLRGFNTLSTEYLATSTGVLQLTEREAALLQIGVAPDAVGKVAAYRSATQTIRANKNWLEFFEGTLRRNITRGEAILAALPEGSELHTLASRMYARYAAGNRGGLIPSLYPRKPAEVAHANEIEVRYRTTLAQSAPSQEVLDVPMGGTSEAEEYLTRRLDWVQELIEATDDVKDRSDRDYLGNVLEDDWRLAREADSRGRIIGRWGRPTRRTPSLRRGVSRYTSPLDLGNLTSGIQALSGDRQQWIGVSGTTFVDRAEDVISGELRELPQFRFARAATELGQSGVPRVIDVASEIARIGGGLYKEVNPTGQLVEGIPVGRAHQLFQKIIGTRIVDEATKGDIIPVISAALARAAQQGPAKDASTLIGWAIQHIGAAEADRQLGSAGTIVNPAAERLVARARAFVGDNGAADIMESVLSSMLPHDPLFRARMRYLSQGELLAKGAVSAGGVVSPYPGGDQLRAQSLVIAEDYDIGLRLGQPATVSDAVTRLRELANVYIGTANETAALSDIRLGLLGHLQAPSVVEQFLLQAELPLESTQSATMAMADGPTDSLLVPSSPLYDLILKSESLYDPDARVAAKRELGSILFHRDGGTTTRSLGRGIRINNPTVATRYGDLAVRDVWQQVETGELPAWSNGGLSATGEIRYVVPTHSGGYGAAGLPNSRVRFFDIETPYAEPAAFEALTADTSRPFVFEMASGSRSQAITGFVNDPNSLAPVKSPIPYLVDPLLDNERRQLHAEIRNLLTDIGGQSPILGGQGQEAFDIPVLIHRLSAYGDAESIDLARQLSSARTYDLLKTLRAWQAPGTPAALQSVRKRLGIAQEVAHQARGDVKATIDVSDEIARRVDQAITGGRAVELTGGMTLAGEGRILQVTGFVEGGSLQFDDVAEWATTTGRREVPAKDVVGFLSRYHAVGDIQAARSSQAAEFFQHQLIRMASTEDLTALAKGSRETWAFQNVDVAMQATGLNFDDHRSLFALLAEEPNVERRLVMSNAYWKSISSKATATHTSNMLVINPMGVSPGEPAWFNAPNARDAGRIAFEEVRDQAAGGNYPIDAPTRAAQAAWSRTKKTLEIELLSLESELSQLDGDDVASIVKREDLRESIAQTHARLRDLRGNNPSGRNFARNLVDRIEAQAVVGTNELLGLSMKSADVGEMDRLGSEVRNTYEWIRDNAMLSELTGAEFKLGNGVSRPLVDLTGARQLGSQFEGITPEDLSAARTEARTVFNTDVRVRRAFYEQAMGFAQEEGELRLQLLERGYFGKEEEALDLNNGLPLMSGDEEVDGLIRRAELARDRRSRITTEAMRQLTDVANAPDGKTLFGTDSITAPPVLSVVDGAVSASPLSIESATSKQLKSLGSRNLALYERELFNQVAPNSNMAAMPELTATGTIAEELGESMTPARRFIGADDAVESIAFLKDHLPTPRMKQAGMLLGGGIALMAATGMLLPHGNARKTNTEEWGPNATVRGAGIAEAPPVSLTNQRVVVEAYDRHGQDVSKVRRALKHMVPGGAMPDVRLADETVEMSREDIKALMAEYMNAK